MGIHYNIAFTGFGSIARRHFQNIRACLAERGDSCSVDLYRSDSPRPLPPDAAPFIAHELPFSAPIPDDAHYDVVFVTNPTSMHLDTLRKFSGHTAAFFVEKPVFDQTSIDKSIFSELRDTTCYVACPLRYHPVLAYVKEHVPLQQVISARAICSSYLPDWRPGQDYRQCYSAHRDMGGGVGIDLIHEWDYLVHLFGLPQECHTIQTKLSGLEIDSDDLAIYIARTDTTSIEVHLDYFGRHAMRTLDLLLPDDSLHCDLLEGTIDYQREGRRIHLDAQRNNFQLRELEHFLDIIHHHTNNDSTLEHAFNVLRIAKGEY